MSDDERNRLAYAIQGIMANELWADPDFDVNGTGPASFKIADLLRSELANARNTALEEAAKAADTIGAGFAQYRDHWPMRDGAYEAARAIRALKAEGESRTPVETGES